MAKNKKIEIVQVPAIECIQLESPKYSRFSAISMAESEPNLFVCSVAFRSAASKERTRRALNSVTLPSCKKSAAFTLDAARAGANIRRGDIDAALVLMGDLGAVPGVGIWAGLVRGVAA